MVTHHGTSLPLFSLFCCSILSTKHDTAVYPINEVESNEVEAFNEKVTQMFHNLALVETNELLSVSWILKLLDGFLSCQEQFRVLLSKNKACLSKHGLEILLSDYFERSVKSLDICNVIRDGMEEMKLWTKELEFALRVLNDKKTLGEAQFGRAKRVLNDLEMKINDGNESGSHLAQKDQSFNLKTLRYRESESLAYSKSFTWSVSRSWSASKQLQVIGENIMVPKRSEIIATNGLVSAIYTMSHVLHFVMWTLVAALPCQGHGLQSPFGIPINFAWGDSILSLQERILNEYNTRGRRNSCGLLKEIHGIGKHTRYLNGLANSTKFPLVEEQEGEMKKRIEKLRNVHKSLKNGLNPLERRVREVFLGIVRCRNEELNVLARPLEFEKYLMNNDGFQKVGKKKKKGKAKSTNENQFVGPSVKQNVRYEPKAATSEPKKGANTVGTVSKFSSVLKSTSPTSKEDNIAISNSYAALVNDEDEDGEHVANLNEESANLNPNTGESSSFTIAAG